MTTRPDHPHLLTVLHAAERSGPPLFALQFLRWLAEAEPSWRFSTVFLDATGPMEQPFGELGPVVLADGRAPYSSGRRRVRRALVRYGDLRLRRELTSHGRVDLAHVHCAGSMKVMAALPPVPVLGHLHELSVGLDLHLGPRARRYVTHADRYVAVSEGVRTLFLERFDVDPARVERQWGFLDPQRLRVAAGRADLGVPDDAFLVVASGVRHWRKGPELFVRLASVAARLAPEIPWSFVWVGGSDAGGLESLAAEAGLGSIVRFLTHQPEPMAWLRAADMFALTAREDAFPLVCVEATAAGTPIITFENGGAAELVRAAGSGVVTPALDIEAMASALCDLARDPDRRAALATAGAAFAPDQLFIDRAGPRLLASLVATMEGPR